MQVLSSSGQANKRRSYTKFVPHACRVSFVDISGIEHAVQVQASTMYEAAGLAIAAFRAAKLHECEPGVMTELEVQVMTPAASHRLRVRKFEEWLHGGIGKNAKEQLVKVTLQKLLSE